MAAAIYEEDIVKMLLHHDLELIKTVAQSNTTPLISASMKGHLAASSQRIALKNSTFLEISRSNGKNALCLAARLGHVDVVQALLENDPQLARRTDKKGQIALHTAVKGFSWVVVRVLLQADTAIVLLPEKLGYTALHIATWKKRVEVRHVRRLLMSSCYFGIQT